MNLRTLQLETDAWRQRNFPDYTAADQFEGMVEELGELAHSRLKLRQRIRGGAIEEEAVTMIDAEMDAIGDLVIFLAGYCSSRNFDLQEIVIQTWNKVSRRDWIADPVSGGE